MRRVNEAVREVLSSHIGKDLKDPRIGFVTVTAVETSPDLRNARVFVSVLGDAESANETLDGLRALPWIPPGIGGRSAAHEAHPQA